MLLVLTNSSDATADYLLSHLTETSVPFVRLDTDSALDHIAVSYEQARPLLRIDGRWYAPEDFSTLWYRRPERLQSDRIPDTPEGNCVLDEWSESLEGFFAHIPRLRWINYPAANTLASRKLEQLTVASRLGFSIPETLVTQDEEAAKAFFDRHEGEIVCKPLGRAYIERTEGHPDSLIYTNRVTEKDMNAIDNVRSCPTFFQQSIDKESDIRITVVDDAIHAVELRANDADGRQRCDIRRNNMADVRYASCELPNSIRDRLHVLTSHYSLRFAAIDMVRATNGEWVFLEVNPNGQWAWLDLCGATEIYRSFLSAFANATRPTEGGDEWPG